MHATFAGFVLDRMRGTGQSAAGIAIMAYHADGSKMILHRAGQRLGYLPSVFLAEALAMEFCFQSLANLLI